MQQVKIVIGLMNERGEFDLKTIDSPLLLNTLARFLAVSEERPDDPEHMDNDEVVFNAMTATNPEVVDPEDYELACVQLGLVYGFIEQAIKSQNTHNKNLN